MARFILIAAALISFGLCTPASATTYTVRLANGNTIQANSYRVEKNKVFLKYPVGEGAFSVSQVVSITADDGSVNLFQSQGELKQAEKKAAPQGTRKGNLPFDPDAFKKNVKEHLKAAKEARDKEKAAEAAGAGNAAGAGKMPFAGNPDPQRDALIDQLDTADDAKRAEIEKKLFDDLPETSERSAPKDKVQVSGGKK